MIIFRYSMLLLLLVSSYSAHLFADTSTNKAFRDFWHPTYLGQRLAYCTLDGKECGKAVANSYCQILGFDSASHYVIAHNVGLTNYLSTRARCTGWSCNGFMTIACVSGLSHNPPKPYHYREKTFENPRYANYRINWCYDRNNGCGMRAANSFCSRMGFLQAKQIVKEISVGATKTIGSQELCFGTQCHSFSSIVCYR
ncbi:MAG: hypothetical protein ACHP6H_00670 [Legionellales bacterium]